MAIKIYKNIWFVKRGTKDDLAYMTQVDESNSAFMNKVETGCKWAGVSVDTSSGEYLENAPVEGFYIGSSVSRWTTSNKLFRVKDPRGFVVEVPTDNIATLLHLTTVKNGVVQEKCVWGRDGANHILLPVNSEPYMDGLKNNVKRTDMLKPSSLRVGDICTLLVHGHSVEAKFLGREHTIEFTVNKHNMIMPADDAMYWEYPKLGDIAESTNFKSDGRTFVFRNLDSNYNQILFISKPNVVEILRNDPEKAVYKNVSQYNAPVSIRTIASKIYPDFLYTRKAHWAYGNQTINVGCRSIDLKSGS